MAQEVQDAWATARRRRRLANKTFEAADYELYDSKVRSIVVVHTQLKRRETTSLYVACCEQRLLDATQQCLVTRPQVLGKFPGSHVAHKRKFPWKLICARSRGTILLYTRSINFVSTG